MSASILIADDDPNLRLSLEFLLQREGYTVHLAQDGQQAMDLAHELQPGLVLLEVALPRKSGFEVCQALRQDDRLQNTQIIILSAKAQETDIAKGLALGANAYMTKPFSSQALVERVRTLLGSAA